MTRGSCICGSVSFTIEGELGPVEYCHCRQCRQWTGHVFASVEVPRSRIDIQGLEHLCWHQRSDRARRGFCGVCGSSLFFEPIDQVKHDWIGVAMGAIEAPTGTQVGLHIFVAEKGDYYEICDGARQNP
ncbi:MAG TPA: GFA family protein [Arenimonas sp.]|nr:GFA family protein [Arenimonas sp.]